MKLTSQMPLSTSFSPGFWPASTVETLIFFAMHADASARGDEVFAVVEGVGQVGQSEVGLA